MRSTGSSTSASRLGQPSWCSDFREIADDVTARAGERVFRLLESRGSASRRLKESHLPVRMLRRSKYYLSAEGSRGSANRPPWRQRSVPPRGPLIAPPQLVRREIPVAPSRFVLRVNTYENRRRVLRVQHTACRSTPLDPPTRLRARRRV